MNYTKPALTLIEAAKSAIQGTTTPKTYSVTDNLPQAHIQTAPAYEGDE